MKKEHKCFLKSVTVLVTFVLLGSGFLVLFQPHGFEVRGEEKRGMKNEVKSRSEGSVTLPDLKVEKSGIEFFGVLGVGEKVLVNVTIENIGNRQIYNTTVLDTAEKAAKWVMSQAVSESGGYKWPYYQGSNEHYSACMEGGNAGVGTFLLEMYHKTGNSTYLEYAKGAAKWIIAQAVADGSGYKWTSKDNDNPSGWYLTAIQNGASGVGEFLLKMYKTTGNATYLEYAKGAARWLMDSTVSESGGSYIEYNPDHQAAFGVRPGREAKAALFLLHLYEVTNNQTYLETLNDTTTWLINKAISENGGYKWVCDVPYKNIYLINEMANITEYFYKIYLAFGNETYLHYANGTIHWLITQAAGDNNFAKWTNKQGNTVYYLTLHGIRGGAPTMIDALLYAYSITGNTTYLNYAEKNANWIINQAVAGGDGYKFPRWEGGTRYTAYRNAILFNALKKLSEVAENATYSQYADEALDWIVYNATTENGGYKWLNGEGDYRDRHYLASFWWKGGGVSGIGYWLLQANIQGEISATVKVYEGDPDNGGTLIGTDDIAVGKNTTAYVQVEWTPKASGVHEIYVVVDNVSPGDGNLSNNVAVKEVEVTLNRFNQDGNILVCASDEHKIYEITRDGKVVWIYDTGETRPMDADRLENGTTLISLYTEEEYGSRVIIVDKYGNTLWDYPMNGSTGPTDADMLLNGNILIAYYNTGKVLEVNKEKEIVWEKNIGGQVDAVERIENNHTLIGNAHAAYKGVVEIDYNGTEIWSYDSGNWNTRSIQKLENGNILIVEQDNSNYNTPARVREINRNKEVVWEYNDIKNSGSAKRIDNNMTLLADYGNDRVIIINKNKEIIWEKKGIKGPCDADLIGRVKLFLESSQPTYQVGETVTVNAISTGNDTNINFEVKYPNGTTMLTKSIQTITGGHLEADEYTVSLWHFDEGEGDTVYDETENDNDGIITGATWIKGKFGKAISFDRSTSEYVDLGNFDLPGSEGTIEMWIKPNETDYHYHLFVKGINRDDDSGYTFFMRLHSNGTLDAKTGSNSGSKYCLTPANVIEWGKWQHIAFTWTSSDSKFYVNGNLVKTGEGMTIAPSNHSVAIGKWGELYYPECNYNGSIDEVRISNIARTSQEIKVASTEGQIATFRFTLPTGVPIGNYTVLANTTETYASTSFSVVMSPKPLAIIDLVSPEFANPGTPVNFSGHGIAAQGKILEYLWTSSIDGYLSSEQEFTLTNLSLGNHLISLRVKDEFGQWSNETSTSLTIAEPNIQILSLDLPKEVSLGSLLFVQAEIYSSFDSEKEVTLALQLENSEHEPLDPVIQKLTIQPNATAKETLGTLVKNSEPTGIYSLQLQAYLSLPRDGGFALDFKDKTINVVEGSRSTSPFKSTTTRSLLKTEETFSLEVDKEKIKPGEDITIFANLSQEFQPFTPVSFEILDPNLNLKYTHTYLSNEKRQVEFRIKTRDTFPEGEYTIFATAPLNKESFGISSDIASAQTTFKLEKENIFKIGQVIFKVGDLKAYRKEGSVDLSPGMDIENFDVLQTAKEGFALIIVSSDYNPYLVPWQGDLYIFLCQETTIGLFIFNHHFYLWVDKGYLFLYTVLDNPEEDWNKYFTPLTRAQETKLPLRITNLPEPLIEENYPNQDYRITVDIQNLSSNLFFQLNTTTDYNIVEMYKGFAELNTEHKKEVLPQFKKASLDENIYKDDVRTVYIEKKGDVDLQIHQKDVEKLSSLYHIPLNSTYSVTIIPDVDPYQLQNDFLHYKVRGGGNLTEGYEVVTTIIEENSSKQWIWRVPFIEENEKDTYQILNPSTMEFKPASNKTYTLIIRHQKDKLKMFTIKDMPAEANRTSSFTVEDWNTLDDKSTKPVKYTHSNGKSTRISTDEKPEDILERLAKGEENPESLLNTEIFGQPLYLYLLAVILLIGTTAAYKKGKKAGKREGEFYSKVEKMKELITPEIERNIQHQQWIKTQTPTFEPSSLFSPQVTTLPQLTQLNFENTTTSRWKCQFCGYIVEDGRFNFCTKCGQRRNI